MSPSENNEFPIARKARFRKARKLLVLVGRARWRSALRHGVAAAVEHRGVGFPHEYATVIDVGAHHGQFALLAREKFPNAGVICIEPLPEAVKKLETVFQDDSQVAIVNRAIADSDGIRTMHISAKTDSSSLLSIKKSYTDSFPGTEESATVEVPVQTLDQLISSELNRPSLLKIDAQGGEAEVIRSGRETLRRIDAVYAECSFIEFYDGQALAGEIVNELADRGFRLRGAYSVVENSNGECLQADLLFVRDDS